MTPALEVTNLSYCYPEGGTALEKLSFSLAPAESVAILGPNGAGKSTLLLHLNGLLPDRFSGPPAIRVHGEELTAVNLERIRQKVGLLFQDPDDQLISATVFEDVAFGPRQLGLEEDALGHRVRHCLELVGLADFENRSPHRLSHGEKRRVCLAGVLACEPQILVLDEPTSDLDPRARREFKQLLRSLPGAKLIATHDLEFAVDLCPRVLILDGGRLIADGPTLTLLADERLMLAHGLEKPHCLQHHHPH
jgi:cobalt/nickel transport system ATP-binding protein